MAQTYLFQILGACAALALIYGLCVKFQEDGWLQARLLRLGQYSLVSYIVQIGFLQDSCSPSRSTRTLVAPSSFFFLFGTLSPNDRLGRGPWNWARTRSLGVETALQGGIRIGLQQSEYVFNSLEFAIFFPLVATLYFLLPQRWRTPMLLVASCVFYMAFIPAYILILAVTILIDYTAGIYLVRVTGRWEAASPLDKHCGDLRGALYLQILQFL